MINGDATCLLNVLAENLTWIGQISVLLLLVSCVVMDFCDFNDIHGSKVSQLVREVTICKSYLK
jgi:hypothetical protein